MRIHGIALLLALGAGPLLAQEEGVEVSEDPPETPDPPAPPKTIEKTVREALGRLRSYEVAEPPQGHPGKRGVATEAFVLYTRAACGDLRKEDRERLTAWHEHWKRDERHEGFDTPNDLAAAVLALTAANADPKAKPPAVSENANRPPRGSRFDKNHWRLMHECVTALEVAQRRSGHGGWQGAGSDLATTHLVLLALRDAARAGYPVAPELFSGALRFLPKSAVPDKFRKTQPSAADIAMCMVGIWICRERLTLLADPKHPAPEWSRKSAEQTHLLDSVFLERETPPAIDCLWAMEQLGSMTGQAQLGGGSWYREGVNRILAAKWLDKDPETPEEAVSICFALLFLKRQTAPLAAGK